MSKRLSKPQIDFEMHALAIRRILSWMMEIAGYGRYGLQFYESADKREFWLFTDEGVRF